jgi:hypothetical protein
MARNSASGNSEEIARLRKRQNLARALFFGSIAFIPLSCFGGCGLAMLIHHETTQAIFGMVGLFAPFIGLGGLILMWSDRGRYGRSLDLALLADKLGLAFTEHPPKKQMGLLKQLQVFHEPTSQAARNSLAGDYKNASVVIMDYSCAWGRGRFAYVIAQTVFVFPDEAPEAPDLILYPKGLFSKLVEAVGLQGRPIPVPGEKQLNKEYGLYSEEADAAAARFTSAMAEACLQENKLVLEVSRGDVLVYWMEQYIKPGELQARLATALKLTRLLKQGG